MNTAEFPFGVLRVLDNCILEVEIAEGVTMTDSEISEIQTFAYTHFNDSFGLLVNRKNRYRHSPSSFKQLQNWSTNLKAIAILSENKELEEYFHRLDEDVYGMEVLIGAHYFENIDSAKAWLIKVLEDS